MKVLRYLPRFRRAYREMRVLEAREVWSRGEIEAFQLDRLNGVWGHAVQHVAHYRGLRERIFGSTGLCASFLSVGSISPLSTFWQPKLLKSQMPSQSAAKPPSILRKRRSRGIM